MWFYLIVALLFTVYALDLLFLVVVAMVARHSEIRELARKNKHIKPPPVLATARDGKAHVLSEAAAAAAGTDPSDNSSSSGSGEATTAAAAAAATASEGFASAHGDAATAAAGGDMAGSLGSGMDSLDPAPSSSSLGGGGYGGYKAMTPGRVEAYAGKFPKVLIQLPMYNEEAHCDLIISRCCKLNWPRDRLLIQVLDDSTRESVRKKVDDAAAICVESGHPVQVLRRDNRSGFKAGAMVEGLNRVEGQGFEYAAIFDADFEPAHVGKKTLRQLAPVGVPGGGHPPLAHEPPHGLRPDTLELCQLQHFPHLGTGFHFDVEQRARSYLGWFFNFNGTAGVWRIAAIHDAGGWQSDTVVEDMDLSLRCYIRGWSAVYLPHVDNPNELPSTLSSYKTQQFRWLSGPMQILVKCFKIIWNSKDISFLRRLNCYWFFARYIIFALITVTVVAVPPVALWLDQWEWQWPEYYFLISINFALAVYLYVTPFSLPYLLFSVAIGYYKTWAMASGLLGLEKSKTWKVTQKFGQQAGGSILRNLHKPYLLEILMGTYYAAMATAAGLCHNWMMLAYCAIMSVVFMTLSLGDNYM